MDRGEINDLEVIKKYTKEVLKSMKSKMYSSLGDAQLILEKIVPSLIAEIRELRKYKK